jgi:hypothetical protein
MQAIVTCQTSHVMMNENPIADVKILDFATLSGNHASRFMPENKRSTILQIPIHKV